MKSPFLLLPLCGALLFGACSDHTSARLVKGHAGEADLQRRVRLVRERVMDGTDSTRYRMFVAGEAGHEQTYRNVTEDLGKGDYRYTEFSGVFVDMAAGSAAYSGVDFELFAADTADHRDSIIRPIQEFKVILTKETTEVRQSGESCFVLDDIRLLKANGATYQVYRLLGLEGPVANYTNHFKTGLALPVNDHRYWVPEFGTVLTYFGDDMTYELVQTANPAEQKAIEALRKAIVTQWKPAK